MAKEMLELHNTGSMHAKVWKSESDSSDPVSYTIPPHTIMPFEDEIANLFLAEYPGTVIEYRLANIPDIQSKDGKTHRRTWIANATGNPFQPPTVFIPSPREGEKPIEIANPLNVPQELRWEIKAPESVELDESGLPMSHHYPALPLTLPPYERISVPEPVAMQLIQRDSTAVMHQRGKLIACREPQAFEPNRTWPYNDLILYARLADEHFFNAERLKENFPSEEALNHDKPKILEKRAKLWEYIFHMVIDKRRGLPPKSAFEAAKRKLTMEIKQPGSTAVAARSR